MDHISLSAQTRELSGKAVKRLRRAGQIPVVVYGGPVRGSLSLTVDERELQRVLATAGSARVIDLTVEGQKYPVLVREVQRHLTRHEVTHVDFLAVRLDQLIQAEVRLSLTGDTSILEANPDAMLSQVMDRLTVETLPDRLPAGIEIDVSGLTDQGQSITVADLPVQGDYTIISAPDTLIVSVVATSRGPVEAVDETVDEVELEADGETAESDEADEVAE